MNSNILNRLSDVAKAMKPIDHGGKSFHASFAVKKGRVVSIGINDYRKSHPYHRFGKYAEKKDTFETPYRACLHSEVSLAIKLGVRSWEEFEIVNIRVGANDILLNSKPCANCERLIINPLNPKRLFYTNEDGEFKQL